MGAQIALAKNLSVNSAMQLSNRLRLCARDGVILKEISPTNATTSGVCSTTTRGSRPNLYTKYVEKVGTLPQPDAANTIGRLLGVQVKACDGKLYPRPTNAEKFSAKQKRDRKRAYHQRADQIANLKEALRCLEAIQDPAYLAIHIKSEREIGPALDSALDCLARFAEEWHNREQSCHR